jgi:hypothetical protein
VGQTIVVCGLPARYALADNENPSSAPQGNTGTTE